jgi:anti-sigma B factor antagonist
MSFSAKTRKVGDVIIVDMNGELTIGEPTLLLRETIRRFIADGNLKFILNLANLTYVDSAGLGELITAYTTVRNRQGDVKLLKVTGKMQGLLQTTKLVTVFDTYNDEQKALASFSA